MEKQQNKLSIWHLMWEEDLLNWLNSINIDTSHIDVNRPYDFAKNIRKNEIFFYPLRLIINWKSDNESVTELYITLWNNGFESDNHLHIEKKHNGEIIINTKNKKHLEPYSLIKNLIPPIKNNELESKYLIKIVEEFVFKLFPKYFRDWKIKKILEP